MNSRILVDLLLELNVHNTGDIDREMNQLAAGVIDPRGAAWIRRVARFFVINIEQLLNPRTLKASERGGSRYKADFQGAEIHAGPSKYHFSPSGKWIGNSPDKALPSEPSDLEQGAWRTQFHQPQVQKDIDANFSKFNPKKAPSKSILWGPPTKDKLAPWMKDFKAKRPTKAEPGTPENAIAPYQGGLYHFDPIVVRRRELFLRLQDAVNYFNWMTQVSKVKSEDPMEQENARQAALLFRQLETMKTADHDGFVDILQRAEEFAADVENDPEKFTPNKPTVVHRFPDGWRVVHLHTMTQFKTESDRMNHCVGNSSTYFDKFNAGTHDYYSLRDPRGVPKVTMEVTRGPNPRAIQVKGHSNYRPNMELQKYVDAFFQKKGIQLENW